MGKFEGILFCTDLDGTLYASDKSVSERNLEAIEYFKAEGGSFTFITGRVPKTSADICRTIKPNVPYGCINGGGIFDHVNNEYLWFMELDKAAVAMADQVARELPDFGIQLNSTKEIYSYRDNQAMVDFRRITGVDDVECPEGGPSEPLVKIIFGHNDAERFDELAKLLKAHPLAENFDFIRSEKRLYEILPKGINKGVGLARLAELLGIDIKRTIAVGDYNNDVEMVKQAALGFAVANAVDEVKAVADVITVSNDESAIAEIIAGLDEGRYKI